MDKYTWQLDDLYPGYESIEYQEDVRRLEELVEEYQELELVATTEAVRDLILKEEERSVLLSRLSAYSRLRLSTDTTCQEASNERERIENIRARFAKPVSKLKRFLGTVEVDLDSCEVLSEYKYLFEKYQEDAKYLLSDEVEDALSQIKRFGGSSWSNLHSNLTSTVIGDYNGEEITLTQVRNLAYSSEQEIRKKAYEVELTMYDKIKEPIAYALNNIKGEVITESKLRGYKSPLDRTLQESRMKRETIETLMAEVEEALPVFRKYLKQKAKLLGHTGSLPFYDLFAPLGESSEKFTVESSRKYLYEHFYKFSSDMAELVNDFYDKRYIDFYPRAGKRGGAFCSNLPYLKQSRVLLNFDGSFSSVVTIAHELGHAYHGKYIQDHRALNWSYSMPVAETASNFNELLIVRSALEEAEDSNEKLFLLETSISDLTQSVVDIYSRFLFEDSVFKEREDNFLSSEKISQIMLDSQKKAYGDGLDHNYLHPYMWINKVHYYSTTRSYYNFPYTFGALFSRGLFALYQENSDGFVEKYQRMLNRTTVSSVEDTAKVMGIDLTDRAFWKKALKTGIEEVEEFMNLTDE